jgi:hypothetical protein
MQRVANVPTLYFCFDLFSSEIYTELYIF